MISLKKITNLYYGIEEYIRKVLHCPRVRTVEESLKRIRSEYTTEGYLHRNVVYCIKVMSLVDTVTLKDYRVSMGTRIHIKTLQPNVYELIKLLNTASKHITVSEAINEKIQRSRENPLNLRRVTLDDYLVTSVNTPIIPMEVYHAVMLQLEFIQKGLTLTSIKRPGSVDYYNRQLTHLMGEVEALALAFLEIPNVRQRKPQSAIGNTPRP